MNKTIDKTYPEIAEELGDLCELQEQTIKSNISKIEADIFNDISLFRKGSKSSDIIFRHEVRNLEKLLIYFHSRDVFKSGKISKNGISDINIDKICEDYDFVKENDILTDHEKQVFLNQFNADSAKNFISAIKKLSEELTIFLTITVLHYNEMSTEFIDDISEQLNTWSHHIVSYINRKKELKSQNFYEIKVPNCDLNNASLFDNIDNWHYEHEGSLKLNLESHVISSIKEIMRIFYECNDSGKYTRKKLSEIIKDSYSQPDKDELIEQADELWNKYMNERNEEYSESENSANIDFSKISVELDEICYKIIKYKYPKENRNDKRQKVYKPDPDNVKRCVKEYLELKYWLVTGEAQKDEFSCDNNSTVKERIIGSEK